MILGVAFELAEGVATALFATRGTLVCDRSVGSATGAVGLYV